MQCESFVHSTHSVPPLQAGMVPLHVPHVYVPPQPFETVPQLLPEQAVPIGVVVQPHTLAVPPPPHVSGEVQVPAQLYFPPQPFDTIPHLPLQAVAIGVGTHWHVLGEPEHASLLAHAVQRPASAQPLFASVVTHLEPHFLVPAPQVPITHAESWQTSVPLPAAGQLLASQVVSPQP